MHRPRVKICGHTTVDDITTSVSAGADAVGVITDVPVESPRAVSTAQAQTLLESVPPFVSRVLVTMPETPEDALGVLSSLPVDTVQIHASLSPAGIKTVTAQTTATVIAAVDVEDQQIQAYGEAADAVLVDSLDDDNAGGTGTTHNWAKTKRISDALSVPLVLAGGLTPSNVEQAVTTTMPYGVDVASGVEVQPGQKDPDAVAQFITAVQNT